LAEDATLSAAIIDHALSDGDSRRLRERNILCLVHGGYPKVEELLADALHVPKPADPQPCS
jgi:hypothetical protein